MHYYKVIDPVGFLPEGDCTPTAINQKGQVTGGFRALSLPDGVEHAFRFDVASGFTDLGVLHDSHTDSIGWDIDAHGNVVGDSGSADTNDGRLPFLYRADTSDMVNLLKYLAPLDLVPFGMAWALVINDSGEIGGIATRMAPSGASAPQYLWLLKPDKTLVNLSNAIPETPSLLRDLNNHHHLLVEAGGGIVHETFLFDITTGVKTKVTGPIMLYGINEELMATGSFQNDDHKSHAVFFHNGAHKLIGTLAAGKQSSGWAINNKGVIVGATDIGPGGYGTGRAFIYDSSDPDAIMHDLTHRLVYDPSNFGTVVTEALGINDAGQIIAVVELDGVVSRGVLLDPVHPQPPEPPPPGPPPKPGDGVAALMQILFGIINDAPGIGTVGGHGRHVGGGPDDPLGPWRRVLATLTPGQRDVLVGFCINQLGSMVHSPTARQEIQARAAALVREAAGRMNLPSRRLARASWDPISPQDRRGRVQRLIDRRLELLRGGERSRGDGGST